MNDDTFTAFVIDEALDELAPDVRELWQAWLCEQPERQRERDAILAALEAARDGVERDPAFLHPADAAPVAIVGAAPGIVSADQRLVPGARVLPYSGARARRGSPGRSFLKQAAALALLLVVAGSGYLAGSRSTPAPISLTDAVPSVPASGVASPVPASEPELEPAAPSLAGAWARYHWSLESEESSLSLRQAPGTDPL